MSWRDTVCRRLSAETAALVKALDPDQADGLEEMRFRIGRRSEFVIRGHSLWAGNVLVRKGMDELLAALTGYALYSCEREMAEGYIPLPGGHRAGVCGKMSFTEDGRVRLHDVSSVCLRIARSVKDCDAEARHWYFSDGKLQNLLLLGPPGCGKTTLLRSAAKYLSGEEKLHVCVVDEREEFFGGGMPEQDCRLDVLSGMGKAQAMPVLIRSMAPRVIVIDEIGRPEDAEAVRDAARCGIVVFASAHAASMEDVSCRPTLRALYEEAVFDRYVLIGARGSVMGVWNKTGNKLD